MKLFGYLAVAAAVASLLIVSSGFHGAAQRPDLGAERRRRETDARRRGGRGRCRPPISRRRRPPIPRRRRSRRLRQPPAALAALPASRSSTPDPDATGTLPKELDGAPKALPEAQPAHAPREPRQARPPRQAAPRLADAAPARRAPASREPIQFRLAEGRN